MSDKEYYSLNKLLSYNRLINMVVSGRGTGKSYGAKKMAIKNFINKGEQFVYVRRYKTELKDIDKFFEDIKYEFPDNNFSIKGKTAYIDGNIAGYFIPLSTSHNQKSVPYPLVTTILFDEFIIDKQSARYLPNEVERFLDLVSTVIRDRNNLRCILLGNNVSIVNPYFSYWSLLADNSRRFTISKNGEVLLEMFTSEEISNRFKQTRFGKLINGTTYGDYNLENISLRDNANFIEKDKPLDARLIFSFIYNGKEYGVWSCEKDGIFYINTQCNKNSVNRYSVTKADHAPNLLLLSSLKRKNEIKILCSFFQQGLVYFNNSETKSDMFNVFSLLNMR